jgi:hypothetical protein
MTSSWRVEAATFTVANLNDSGAGSLRQAILDANLAAGADMIDFAAGLTGTITLMSALPQITSDVTINGPGAAVVEVSGASSFQVFNIASGVTASISGLTISNGRSANGGGIANAGALTVTNSTFSGNSAVGTGASGGGIDNNLGTVMITNSTFSGNSAFAGGGIANDEGTLTVTNSTLSGNSAGGGGGISNVLGTVTITNSTISGNSANFGGGIANDEGTLTVTNSTLSGNSAASFGGGIISDGTDTFKNSIIANSPSGGNCVGQAIAAQGVNFSDDDTCPGFTQVTSAQLNLDPLLQDNGGPTLTHALLAGSVAIDAVTDCTDLAIPAVAVATDQRGQPRPADGDSNGSLLCDAGAFEMQLCLITCPADITVSNDANQCGAVVNYPPPAAGGDTCGTVTCSPTSGSFFPVGTTTVSCDDSGTTANPDCTFTITVNDTQNPTISCPQDITITGDPSGMTTVTYPPPTVSDNCQPIDDGEKGKLTGVEPPFTIVCIPPSGSSFAFGTTTVTCTYSDGAGNLASCSFTVTINAPCQVICPANQTVSNDAEQCGAVVNYPAATTTGVCSTQATCTPAPGSFFPVGTTSVTCTADDENGRPVSCTFSVTVNDTQPPAITCPASVTAVAAPACPPAAATAVSFPPPVATDNCPGVTVACVPPSGSPVPVGTTTVTCTATDTSGNRATCSFSVSTFNACIQDDSNPSNVILFNTQTGEYRACCGGVVYSGVGTITRQGCDFTLQSNSTTHRVTARWSSVYYRGSGSVQAPAGTTRCLITDRNIRNNSCQCQPLPEG